MRLAAGGASLVRADELVEFRPDIVGARRGTDDA
jgi:hypothetical protein